MTGTIIVQIIHIGAVQENGIWLVGKEQLKIFVDGFFAVIAAIRWVADKAGPCERVEVSNLEGRAD